MQAQKPIESPQAHRIETPQAQQARTMSEEGRKKVELMRSQLSSEKSESKTTNMPKIRPKTSQPKGQYLAGGAAIVTKITVAGNNMARDKRPTTAPQTLPVFEWKDGVGLVEKATYEKLHSDATPDWPPRQEPHVATKRQLVICKQQQLAKTGSSVAHSADRQHYPYFAQVSTLEHEQTQRASTPSQVQRFPVRPLVGDWNSIGQLETDIKPKTASSFAGSRMQQGSSRRVRDNDKIKHTRLHYELSGSTKCSLSTQLGYTMRQHSEVLPLKCNILKAADEKSRGSSTGNCEQDEDEDQRLALWEEEQLRLAEEELRLAMLKEEQSRLDLLESRAKIKAEEEEEEAYFVGGVADKGSPPLSPDLILA